MKKIYLAAAMSAGMALAASQASAIDLLQTYQMALKNDQTYANAVGTAKVAAQKSPQALAVLLPQINGTSSGSWSQTHASGTASNPGSSQAKIFEYGATLKQQIFNYTDWLALQSANSQVKSAYATLSYAKQTLVVDTSKAYFAVLSDRDVLRFDDAEKKAVYQQYVQAKESFNVGTKTITDVDQARAAYDSSVAQYISDENQLNTDIEALSVITGKIYTDLTPLAKQIDLVTPDPKNVSDWIHSTIQHNWQIIADRYTVLGDKASIKSEWGGHLPTLEADAGYNGKMTRTKYKSSNSTARTRGPSVSLDLSIPIFSGFNVTSQVRQAIAQQQTDQATLELDQRTAVQNVRTQYAAVGYDISLIHANYNTVISDRSSLNSTIEGYKVGTQTMTDVLTAEQKLYSDLSTWAKSRYQYLNDAIALKQAAGTLGVNDIASINSWLAYPSNTQRPTKKTDGVDTAANIAPQNNVSKTSNTAGNISGTNALKL